MLSKLQLIEHCAKTGNFEPITIYLLIEIAYSTNISLPKFIEILRGAHVVVRNDNGNLYRKWKIIATKNKLRYPRISSHPSVKKQYEINAGYYNDNHFSILCGAYYWKSRKNKLTNMVDPKILIEKYVNYSLKLIEGKLSTWFQLEKVAGDYRINGFWGVFEHLKTYQKYIQIKKNIGIFGESKFTESPWNPLYINCISNINDEEIYKKDKYLSTNYPNINTKEKLFKTVLLKYFKTNNTKSYINEHHDAIIIKKR